MAKKSTSRKGQPPKRPAPRKPRITTKRVQATEGLPPPSIPDIAAKPDIDEDAWDPDGLTLKQRRFCEFYVGVAAGNGTKAAELAGYRVDNRHALEATAYENLRKPAIRGYIARLLARAGMTADFLKLRLAELARSSMDNFLTVSADGEVSVDLKQAAALGALGQLKELKEEGVWAGGVVSIVKRTVKIHDPRPSIETLAKMLGVLVERRDITSDGKPIKGYADIDDGDDSGAG